MKSEYDFSKMRGGVRGKYYKPYQAGHIVKINKKSGKVSLSYFKPEEGSVVLEPDVRKYFPNAESVNSALRSLINLIPANRGARSKRATSFHHA